MADSDYSYATWVAKGQPGGDFTAWQRSQPGYGVKGGGGANGQTWEEYSAQNGDSPASQRDWAALNPGHSTQVAGGDGTVPSDPNSQAYKDAYPAGGDAGGSKAPASFEQRFAAGEFKGNEANAVQLEARRRRNLLTGDGMKPLPADVADIVLRDASGQVRKARSATTQNALGAAFNVKSSLFGDR